MRAYREGRGPAPKWLAAVLVLGNTLGVVGAAIIFYYSWTEWIVPGFVLGGCVVVLDAAMWGLTRSHLLPFYRRF